MHAKPFEIFLGSDDESLEACFPAFHALRPHLTQECFLQQVRRQQEQGYQILALRHEGMVKSAAGFRLTEFLAWGRVLYIDDLTTLPGETSQGFAGALLDWLIDHAKTQRCDGLHLDTGYARHAAHRLYLRKGLEFNGHHLALDLHAGV